MNKNWLKDYGSVVLAMLFWSFTFVWYKIVFEELNPLSTVLFRLIISSGLMIPFTLLTKKLKKMEKGDFKLFLLLAFFEPFLYFIGESFGMQLVSPTIGAVVIATIPLFAPLLTYRFSSDRLSFKNYLGIFISILGVFIVIFQRQTGLDANLKGILILFIAVFATAGYSVSITKISAKYNPLSIITYQNFIGMFFFAPLFFIFEFNHFKQAVLTKEVVIALIELAVFGSSLAFIFFIYSIKRIGFNRANSFTNLIPVFTAIFSFIVLKEVVSLQKWIGILIVISGLFLSQSRKKGNKQEIAIVKNV